MRYEKSITPAVSSLNFPLSNIWNSCIHKSSIAPLMKFNISMRAEKRCQTTENGSPWRDHIRLVYENKVID